MSDKTKVFSIIIGYILLCILAIKGGITDYGN